MPKEVIHIYHTNDLHSHFDHWPQIHRFLHSKKKMHEAANETCYIFDIGDHVDRSHPFTEGTEGRGNVELLNRALYDAVTIGNNEGITLSKEALSQLYTDANFPVIVGNLLEHDGTRPTWLTDHVVFTTKQGLRVGIIGATAPYTDFYSILGWKITEPIEQLKKLSAELAPSVDVLICLSHLGLPTDERLAAECPELDVILGAHTHHLFMKGEEIQNTLLAATGKFGQYVGHVEIEVDVATRKKVRHSATVYETALMSRIGDDLLQMERLLEHGYKALEEPVFYNPTPMSQNLFDVSPLSNFFGRALLAYTKADCAMFNAGIFLASVDKGWVTKHHLHQLLPHPINPCTVTLDGAELLTIHTLSQNEEWPQIKIKGLGFRGAMMGAMLYEQLFTNHQGHLYVGNREVIPGESYTLATLDMFTFGFFFPTLKDAQKNYFAPELIRDVFAWYGKQTYSSKFLS